MRRRSGRAWAIASAGLLSGLVACRPSARQGAASSGLAVIESNAPLWSEGKGRSLVSAPTVDIGGVAEAITALRLSDGRLVVAQADPFHLGYFAPDGRHLYDAGGGEDG
ncbi:MAG TPA: hypothetical protein VFI13_01945, partial [Gemmatimonadales bacterium]|nr:hypothetical protein [Gemmatimonadales bacterium]